MILWTIRHTKPYNPNDVCYGRLDFDVSPTFEEEADGAIRAFLATGAKPTRLFSSPLLRCLKLAEKASAATGLAIEKEPAIIELNFGTWEGQKLTAVPRSEMHAWISDLRGFRFPEGENFYDIDERAGKFFAGKAGFISLRWLPFFANYRREGYDFDSRWEDGKASRREKNIMDLLTDRDGGPLCATSVTVPPAMYDDYVEVCKPIMNLNPEFPFTVNKREGDPQPRPTRAGGSDHAYFAKNGIPTLSFRETDPKGYNFEYGEIWHTERDIYNKLIPEYMEHSAVVEAVVLYGLANLDHLLSREGLYSN